MTMNRIFSRALSALLIAVLTVAPALAPAQNFNSVTRAVTAKIDQTSSGTSNAVASLPVTIVANQSIAYTGTAGQSATTNASTTFTVITCTTDCYIAISSNPTATTSDLYLPAYTPSPPLKVTGGTSKVSAIRDSASGTMKLAEFSY